VSRSFFVTLVSIGALLCALARADGEPLDAILSRMDQSAKQFKSVAASMHQLEYNALLKDSTSSEAELRIRRSKGGFSGVILYKPPETKTVAFAGDSAKIYYPKANEVQKIHAGEYLGYVSEFLLFGTSGKELSKVYTVTLDGEESIGGTATTHLALAPKSPELKKLITKLEVWIPEGESYPIREKATEPSQNAETFSFLDVKINPHLPDSAFELKVPPGTKVINEK